MLNTNTPINLDHPRPFRCFIDDDPEPSDLANFAYPLAEDAVQAAADATALVAEAALAAIIRAKRDRRAHLNAQAAALMPLDAFRVNLTLLGKNGGPLTKLISPLNDTYKSDGSQCWMADGMAVRVSTGFPNEFAEFIGTLLNNEAIALGVMNDGVPDLATILTKPRLEQLNGAAGPQMIARSGKYFGYKPYEPALVLIDVDTKGMPDAVRHRVTALGGAWPAILSAAPELANAARVVRCSTSAGLSRSDTGQTFAGSDGQHIYLLVKDGSTVEHFLRTLHDRCWLMGLGWWRIGNAGQFLNCSLVDRSVYRPEHMVFEANADLLPPMAQDHAARLPTSHYGDSIDVTACCPPLTLREADELQRRKLAAKQPLLPEACAAQALFVGEQSVKIRAKAPDISTEQARRIIEHQIEGALLPDIVLPFDDDDLAGRTVGDVLDNPDAFIGRTLADPLAGVEYGRGKAMVMGNLDGVFINSFAHGGRRFDLKHDVRSIERGIIGADPKDAGAVLTRLMFDAVIAEDERQRLNALVMERSGIKPAPLKVMVKDAAKKHAEKQALAKQSEAKRLDPRISFAAPLPDAERLPVLHLIDEVLGSVASLEPPMRTIEGWPVEVQERTPVGLHELTAAGAEGKEAEESRLPPPAVPLLTRHTRNTLGHLIERNVKFTSGARPVALHPNFIASYEEYRQSTLPVVSAIVTLPVVLENGTLLATPGLDRRRQVVFRISPKLLAMLPTPNQVDDAAIADALDFLINDWLGDVASDFAGKCVLLAYALSIIERTLLPERPVFFVTAGKRGGGKTTAMGMVVLAATGKKPAAAAWSPSEEERRKSLFAYLGQGLVTLCWDNIPTGTSIGCPSIEKACTAATYTDRTLGVSEFREVSATTIQSFTGNNVQPQGDLAARSLIARLEVDRSDPENREFRHPDPIGWTEAHRGAILRALYTILLGNPAVQPGNTVALKTRFKMWWKLVGSAIEHAAALLHARENSMRDDAGEAPAEDDTHRRTSAETIDFRLLFAESEEDEEVGMNVAAILDILSQTYGKDRFTAQPLAEAINHGKDAGLPLLRDLLEDGKDSVSGTVTGVWLGKKLKVLLGNTTNVHGHEMTLRRERDRNGNVFRVDMSAKAAAEISIAKEKATAAEAGKSEADRIIDRLRAMN